jgi:hypothetical protein
MTPIVFFRYQLSEHCPLPLNFIVKQYLCTNTPHILAQKGHCQALYKYKNIKEGTTGFMVELIIV